MRISRFAIIACALSLVACTGDDGGTGAVYSGGGCAVYGDSVVQGRARAVAVSSREIVVTGVDSAAATPRWPLRLRLAICGRDNELPPGQCHYCWPVADTLRVVACRPDTLGALPLPAQAGRVAAGSRVTLRVDLTEMERAFERNGYWVTATQDTVYEDEFTGVWALGDIAPLGWSADALADSRHCRLRRDAVSGMYCLDLNLGAAHGEDGWHGWRQQSTATDCPLLTTGLKMIDAVGNMAAEALGRADYSHLSTLDTSLAVSLGLYCVRPRLCQRLLRARVHGGRIVQDANGHYRWPVTNDCLIWADAAWRVYLATGDGAWLRYSLRVIENTLKGLRGVSECESTGMVHGCDNLHTPAAQYPLWMEPKDYYESMRLSTNVIYARSLYVMAQMLDELERDGSDEYLQRYERVKDAINQHLWNEGQGRYSAYLLDESTLTRSGTVCNYAQALAMLFGIADDDRAEVVLRWTPVSPLGVESLWPRPGAYATGRTEACLQALWALAAAQAGDMEAARLCMASICRQAALEGFGRKGNAAALLGACAVEAVWLRMLAGVTMHSDGLEISPAVPHCFPGNKTLKALRFRSATYDITIKGTGTKIKEFKFDGEPQRINFLPAHITGSHRVEITMEQGNRPRWRMNVAATPAAPAMPQVDWGRDYATITNYDYRNHYSVVVDGRVYSGLHQHFALPQSTKPRVMTYVVASRDKVPGDLSLPKHFYQPAAVRRLPLREYAHAGTSLVRGGLAKTLVEFSPRRNAEITVHADVAQAGQYYLRLRYANGSADWLACPMCEVVVNTHLQDVLVMPQRGVRQWCRLGDTNTISVALLKGRNTLLLRWLSDGAHPAGEPVLLESLTLVRAQ